MYGHAYQEIRKSKKYTLKYCAENIVSIPTLSRWENDETDIPLSKFLQLLNRIDIPIEEFFSLTDLKIGETNTFYKQIADLTARKDASSLYELYLKCISKYHHLTDTDDLFIAAFAANAYLNLTGKNPMKSEDIDKVEQILSDNEQWNFISVRQFGDTLLLLKPKKLLSLALNLLNDTERIEAVSPDLYVNTLSTLADAFYELIKKEPELAKKLDTALKDKLNMKDVRLSFFYIRFSFLSDLLSFRLGQEIDFENYFKALDFLNLTILKDILGEELNEIKLVMPK